MDTGFITILLACALYGALHSLLASNTAKAFATRQVGPDAYRRFYRLFYNLVAVVTIMAVFILVSLLPDRAIYRIPAPWLFLTILVQILAAVAVLSGVMQTGAMEFLGIQQILSSAPSSADPEKLVVSGLYRWVRHPLYTATLLFLWLAPQMSWNMLALDIGFSAYLFIGTIFEERKLVEQFGDAYRQYRKRTPRILPGIKIT